MIPQMQGAVIDKVKVNNARLRFLTTALRAVVIKTHFNNIVSIIIFNTLTIYWVNLNRPIFTPT